VAPSRIHRPLRARTRSSPISRSPWLTATNLAEDVAKGFKRQAR
jgi:hypothetical protein